MTEPRCKPSLARYPDVDFHTTIAGIPCGIVVTHYAPEQYNNWGHPDHRLPDDQEEVEFVVVDRKGYEADWLRAKASEVRLESHVLDLIHGALAELMPAAEHYALNCGGASFDESAGFDPVGVGD